jgi:hypothetical protein
MENNLGAGQGAGEENLGELKRAVGYQEEGAVEDVPLGADSSKADSMDPTELEMALKEWGYEEENSRPPSVE